MANHPRRTHRYAKCCPRGFANEVLYVRVPLALIAEASAQFDRDYDPDREGHNASWTWTNDRRATMPGVAVAWADYHHVR
jgi:hypothetical protein